MRAPRDRVARASETGASALQAPRRHPALFGPRRSASLLPHDAQCGVGMKKLRSTTTARRPVRRTVAPWASALRSAARSLTAAAKTRHAAHLAKSFKDKKEKCAMAKKRRKVERFAHFVEKLAHVPERRRATDAPCISVVRTRRAPVVPPSIVWHTHQAKDPLVHDFLPTLQRGKATDETVRTLGRFPRYTLQVPPPPPSPTPPPVPPVLPPAPLQVEARRVGGAAPLWQRAKPGTVTLPHVDQDLGGRPVQTNIALASGSTVFVAWDRHHLHEDDLCVERDDFGACLEELRRVPSLAVVRATRGDIVHMRANTVHMVITLEDKVQLGFHMYD